MTTRKKKITSEEAIWYHYIGLDFLFHKTPIIATQKRTVQQGDAFEDTAFEPWFEIAKS